MRADDLPIAHLNVFQRLVRQWDHVHPYNAAQVMHLSGTPDLPALQQAWYEALSALGLGPVHVRGKQFHFESVNGDASRYAMPTVPPDVCLADFLSLEMNRPFGEADLPLRPFVLPAPGEAGQTPGYYAGVVYQHWIADSESIRLLLREWFVRVYDPKQATQKKIELPTGGYWKLFGPRAARWALDDQIVRLITQTVQLRSVRKLRTLGDNDYNMRFLLRRLPDGTIDRLRRVARAHGATVNDIFLAVMGQLCQQYLPLRASRRRRDLALGTIVDLRGRITNPAALANTFGLFLGFANVTCRHTDLPCWDSLLADISRQTKHHKRSGSAAASALWMWLALTATRRMDAKHIYHFYRRRMPLAAGISNVNLNRSWARKYHPDPLREYIRVSPTGPMVPLVFTPSTLGSAFHVALTYRSSLINPTAAGEMADAFVKRLTELAGSDDALA